MKKLFKVSFDYFPCDRLNQLYIGFDMLRKAGLIELDITRSKKENHYGMLKIIVDDKYTVIYDTMDGFCWLNASIEENLAYFKKNFKSDFLFRRSYNKLVEENAPDGCKTFPMGLNMSLSLNDNPFYYSFFEKLEYYYKKGYSLIKPRFKPSYASADWESYPVPNKKSKILFMTRLWDVNEVDVEHVKEERHEINKNRIEYLRACKQQFGNIFLGGIEQRGFEKEYDVSDILLPVSTTKRYNFIKILGEHNICITSTGLHSSIGWKFSEYISASRAIVSEPLRYDVTGNLQRGINYLEFNNAEELIKSVEILLNDREKLRNMMESNYVYYNSYLQPAKLVLNTLLKIYEV